MFLCVVINNMQRHTSKELEAFWKAPELVNREADWRSHLDWKKTPHFCMQIIIDIINILVQVILILYTIIYAQFLRVFKQLGLHKTDAFL